MSCGVLPVAHYAAVEKRTRIPMCSMLPILAVVDIGHRAGVTGMLLAAATHQAGLGATFWKLARGNGVGSTAKGAWMTAASGEPGPAPTTFGRRSTASRDAKQCRHGNHGMSGLLAQGFPSSCCDRKRCYQAVTAQRPQGLQLVTSILTRECCYATALSLGRCRMQLTEDDGIWRP